MSRIRVTPTLTIDESEIEETFIQSSGPGGQNVNKVATAVQLRFDVAHSPSLPSDVRIRLMKLAGHRLTNDDVLVLTGRQYRLQSRNREDVRARLIRADPCCDDRSEKAQTHPPHQDEQGKAARRKKKSSVALETRGCAPERIED